LRFSELERAPVFASTLTVTFFADTMADEMGDASNPPVGSLTEVAPYVRFGAKRAVTDASWAAAFIQIPYVILAR